MFGNPVQGPRIVPFATARTSKDYLPNGHPSFRVTQRFGDWDAYFRNRIHGAMDLGNFYCGDVVLSMERGYVVHLRDPNGALGIRIEHPSGWATEYWHLVSRSVPNGASVARGVLIGRVGSTGLNIAGCHLHVVAKKPTGTPTDAWPLLDQNIATVRYAMVSAGANLRTHPTGSAPKVKQLTVATRLQIAGAIKRGGTYTYLKDGEWVTDNRWRPVLYLNVKVWVILPFTKVV